MTTKSVDAWWWSDGDHLVHSDDVPAVGITHRLPEGSIPVLCTRGYHASRRLIDALWYAPGSTLWRVRLSGGIVEDTDKLVASERTYIEKIDCKEMLHEFARWCALQVIHLWDAPDVVCKYLTTGREDLRETARAASSAASAASWASSRGASWAASSAASAASAASWAASSAASAASAASWAASSAARAASRAASSAASAASRAASRAAQNERLVEMVAAIEAREERRRHDATPTLRAVRRGRHRPSGTETAWSL